MSQSPITQVSPEGENHAISTIITQVPESKLYSMTKPEDKGIIYLLNLLNFKKI